MASNEFRIVSSNGNQMPESPDAAIHEPMLAKKSAKIMSELMAVESFVRMGISIELACEACAGPETRARLVSSGQLKISQID